ncbi:MAG: hypothetical protein NC916_01450 [Candidatus Omnitrophica bacterium]|nr:hypothetical protein [Candidatus Omnitrophota bacterium]
MNKKGGVVLPFLIILLLVMLSLSGASIYLLQKERSEKMTLRAELDTTEVKYKKASLELDDAKKQIATLNNQLNDANKKIQFISQELEDEKLAREVAFSNIEQLKTELENEKELRVNLENKLKQSEEDAAKINEQLNQLVAQKSQLEAKLKDLEAKNAQAQVELGKIVVGQSLEPAVEAEVVEQQSPKQETPPKQETSAKQRKIKIKSNLKEGKVLVVNRDYKFVVINLGSKDKVSIGDIYSIYHENNYLGDVKVEKVHESMAAAGFMSEDIVDKVSEEDKVVEKVK